MIHLIIFILLSNTLYVSNNTPADKSSHLSLSGCVVAEKIAPQGPKDFPTKHTYTVKLANGSLTNVTYIAYPPSPYGEFARNKIILNFINGTILPGNHIMAYGKYSSKTNTLTISNDGDFIITRSGSGCESKMKE